jgi:hypothetical protein
VTYEDPPPPASHAPPLRHLQGAVLGGSPSCALLFGALPPASGSGQRMTMIDPWWTVQLLKLGEDALAFERIEQMPTRGKGLVQWAHNLVPAVRGGDLDAREELMIVLQILSDRQDQPKPQKQPSPDRLVAKAVAKAKQLGVDVTVEPNGAATFHTGTASAPVDKPQTELDEWITKHAH